MRTLHLHRSNRSEALVEALAEVVAHPTSEVFDSEWLVVNGRGMAVWLSRSLSERLGIWLGDRFLYPRSFVERAHRAVLDGETATATAEPAPLFWHLLALLDELRRSAGDDPVWRPLEMYFRDGGDEGSIDRGREHDLVAALAADLADTFDRYQVYRSDWLRAWAAGNDDGVPPYAQWQPALWRRLLERAPAELFAAPERHRRFIETCLASEARPEGIPPRICVFGLPSLPPLYLQAVVATAAITEVHWFLPLATDAYLGDLLDEKKWLKTLAQLQSDPAAMAAQHYEAGPPLITQLGRPSAELTEGLLEAVEAMQIDIVERDRFEEDPAPAHLLAGVQRAVMTLGDAPPDKPFAPDGSIQLHAVHNPMRAVEALHDTLLARFADDPSLRPHEVLVMLADVETYAPLVDAIFGSLTPALPYRIADRSLRQESPVADALVRIGTLLEGRFRASEVMDALALDVVQRRFALTGDDLEMLRRWVHEAGIRWGIDAAHRERHGQPATDINTWRFGLARMLVGYAAPSRAEGGDDFWCGVFPYDEIEGADGEPLGKLALYCDHLFRLAARASEPQPIEAWQAFVGQLLDELIVHDADTDTEHERIRRTLSELSAEAALAETEVVLTLGAVLRLLEDHARGRGAGRGFLAGGITFSAMVPLRSIPFRVIAVVGLEEASFPRAGRRPSFDLMSGSTRRGDKDRRQDDRYLFLETLLHARDNLLLYYVGRSDRDNSPRAPSPVVRTLTRALAPLLGATPEEAEAALTLVHPLRPFDPRYFDGSVPRSFSETRASAAAATYGRSSFVEPRPIPALDPVVDEAITLDDLIRFWEHPPRYFLETRLGLELPRSPEGLLDRDPLELAPLEQYEVGQWLLEGRLRGLGEDTLFERAQARGALAPGATGAVVFAELWRQVAPIAESTRSLRQGPPRRDERLTIDIGGNRVRGTLADRYEAGQVRAQYAWVSGKHLVRLWLEHLFRAVTNRREPSHLVGRARSKDVPGTPPRGGAHHFSLAPLDAPEAQRELSRLLEGYRRGQAHPFPFTPREALHYAAAFEREQRKRSEEEARTKARDKVRRRLEEVRDADEHVGRLFTQPEDFTEGPHNFFALAEAVLLPLLRHLNRASAEGSR